MTLDTLAGVRGEMARLLSDGTISASYRRRCARPTWRGGSTAFI
jgi:hypothetical protein